MTKKPDKPPPAPVPVKDAKDKPPPPQKERLDQKLRKLLSLTAKKKKDSVGGHVPNPNESVTDSQKQKSKKNKKEQPTLPRCSREVSIDPKDRSVEKEKTQTREETVDDAIPTGTAAWKIKKVDELGKGDFVYGKRMSVRISDLVCTEEHGRVYRAYSTKQQDGGSIAPRKEENIPVALKADVATGAMKKWFTTEKDVLLAINLARPASICDHFPQIFDSGELHFFRYIMMTLHGPNIERLRRDILKADFTLGTACRVAFQTLQTVVDMHTIGYIHRDLKPTNFVVGIDAGGDSFLRTTNLRTIYMVGFGTCVKKKEPQEKVERKFVNLTFGSRKSHNLTHPIDRNDDFESWLYLAVEIFKRGSLPWRKKNRLEGLAAKQKFFEDFGFTGMYEFVPEQFKVIIQKAFNDENKPFSGSTVRDLIKDVARKNHILDKTAYDWETALLSGKDKGFLNNNEKKADDDKQQESTNLDEPASVMLRKVVVFEKNTEAVEEAHSCTSLDPTYSQNAIKGFVEDDPNARVKIPRAIPPDDPLIKLTLAKTKKKAAPPAQTPPPAAAAAHAAPPNHKKGSKENGNHGANHEVSAFL